VNYGDEGSEYIREAYRRRTNTWNFMSRARTELGGLYLVLDEWSARIPQHVGLGKGIICFCSLA